ncbi:hypothetical protein Z948_935 [Sulfitobacter donghicola DSW-25 = KCTC 12864 = JCM 14565]|nr:hypothetical protein Z948_935 [Sulfitobacter donghicola DSW-25 = KCTC 12864 = JCM 14565]
MPTPRAAATMCRCPFFLRIENFNEIAHSAARADNAAQNGTNPIAA